ncbi:MAG: NADH-quinone oxidoreductase subunit L [Syntrophobacteraceae bacterium]
MTTVLTQGATATAALLSTLSPFVSFLLILIFTRSRQRLSATLSLGAVGLSFVCAILLLSGYWGMEGTVRLTVPWLSAGSYAIPFGFLLDPLSLLMLVIVTGISLLVQVYSLGYMAGDPGFSRYYAFMSLFVFSMTNLTLAPTLLQLYIFWELVGLSSYLLIGFWYEKFSATQAGKKAFVMTRAGDVAFFLGLLVPLFHLGNVGIVDMNGPQAAASMSPAMLTLSAVLIFGGIVGKSAQFPLMTWLPDAMEGPTPVSALLHSATMVAAGVYLFARLFPFFSLSATAMTFFLAIGTLSMLLASTMAMVDRDIKKVWAYSTISQLGFMIMALASGGLGGYFSGVYHLTTHAGFKALLFLCSGVFIHHFQTNDMFELSERKCRHLKIPTIAIVLAAAALSGLPPLSGYFSKEAILKQLAALPNPLWLMAALLGVFLTAYYAFRVVFVLCFPRDTGSDSGAHPSDVDNAHAEGHGEAPYGLMAWPLVVLAGITLLLGFGEHAIKIHLAGHGDAGGSLESWAVDWLPVTALGTAIWGAGLAWVEFGRKKASQVGFVERLPRLAALFRERWYLDHMYRMLVDRGIDRGIATLFYQNDNRVIDGSIDGMCKGTVEGGRFIARLHLGMIQHRLVVTLAVLAFLSLYFFF